MKLLLLLVISNFFLVSCLKNESTGGFSLPVQVKKEEDCDDKKAKETLEKIKTEEFSLKKAQDTGCSVDEKKVELPQQKENGTH